MVSLAPLTHVCNGFGFSAAPISPRLLLTVWAWRIWSYGAGLWTAGQASVCLSAADVTCMDTSQVDQELSIIKCEKCLP